MDFVKIVHKADGKDSDDNSFADLDGAQVDNFEFLVDLWTNS